MDVFHQSKSSTRSVSFARTGRRCCGDVRASSNKSTHGVLSTASAVPRAHICRRSIIQPARVNSNSVSFDSSGDEVFESEQSEELLQAYLQKMCGKRSNGPAPTPPIRCLNCTQPAPFNGVCTHCGHAHTHDVHLTFVPLEYTRSAYVYMHQEQQRKLQQQQQQQQQQQGVAAQPTYTSASTASTNTSPRSHVPGSVDTTSAEVAATAPVNGVSAQSAVCTQIALSAQKSLSAPTALPDDGVHPPAASTSTPAASTTAQASNGVAPAPAMSLAAAIGAVALDTLESCWHTPLPSSPEVATASTNTLTAAIGAAAVEAGYAHAPSSSSSEVATASAAVTAPAATSAAATALAATTASSYAAINGGSPPSPSHITAGAATVSQDRTGSHDDTSASESVMQDEGAVHSGRDLEGQCSSAPVLLAWDDRTCLHHNSCQAARDEVTGLQVHTSMHPERPERTQAIVSQLYRNGLLDRCNAVPARLASEEELLAAHTLELIHGVRDLSKAAANWDSNQADHVLDVGGDTYANKHTWEVCTMAAGMAVDVALGVARGQGSHGAAIIRPPGHHAERNGVMGFCFLNHAVIAAKAVQRVVGLERVAIVDWDVHHGNGAQHMLWDDSSVLFVSLHRHDNGNYFPGSGDIMEVGAGEGEGRVLNVPWTMPGMGDPEYLAAFDHLALPVLREFDPQLIIVSAGFDAAASDPLGGCNLSTHGFAQMTDRLKSVGPVVMLLEGGYNLMATAGCFEACLRVLLGEPAPMDAPVGTPAFVALQTISRVLSVHSQYWPCLQPRSTHQLMERYDWLGASSIITQILRERRAKQLPAQEPAGV